MTQSSSELAIIIPAYRARFLAAALDSIATQTNQHFQAYVFDDASPDDLRAVFDASSLAEKSNAAFHRFEQNLGGTSLVAHWNRCVRATRGETWVWLFSDDDIADAHCVERFANAIRDCMIPGYICRFNTVTIDADGACTEINPPHPPSEAAIDFAYHRLRLQRRSFAPEYLFQRAAFDSAGGFVEFPFALGSDDASWITFAGDLPITTLPGAKVCWRFNGENTSTLRGSAALPKFLALADFACWIRRRYSGQSPSLGLDLPTKIDFDELCRQWLDHMAWQLPASVSFVRIPKLAAELEKRKFGTRLRWFLRLNAVLLAVKILKTLRALKRLFAPSL